MASLTDPHPAATPPEPTPVVSWMKAAKLSEIYMPTVGMLILLIAVLSVPLVVLVLAIVQRVTL